MGGEVLEFKGERIYNEGQIQGAISLARKMNMTDKQIEQYLMETFNLTEKEAAEYLGSVLT